MAINDEISDEKLQYDINTKATEISALLSGKIDKYEYLTGNEILSFNQQQIIEQTKFTYTSLKKQLKTKEKSKLKQFKIKGKLKKLNNMF